MAEHGEPSSRAGRAYLDSIKDDPEAQAALRRAQAWMRAFAAALKVSGLHHARREQEQALKALAEAFQEAYRASHQDLAELGFTPPQTLEDWEHLARVVEAPPETIRAGNFTLRDVYEWAIEWERIEWERMNVRSAGKRRRSRATRDALGDATQGTVDQRVARYLEERHTDYGHFRDALHANDRDLATEFRKRYFTPTAIAEQIMCNKSSVCRSPTYKKKVKAPYEKA